MRVFSIWCTLEHTTADINTEDMTKKLHEDTACYGREENFASVCVKMNSPVFFPFEKTLGKLKLNV